MMDVEYLQQPCTRLTADIEMLLLSLGFSIHVVVLPGKVLTRWLVVYIRSGFRQEGARS